MAGLKVYDRNGNQVGTYEIDPADLAPTINKQLLHDAVVMYQANLRQGSHKSKSRGQVAGTTKKMYRQKGTGNARAGSRRSNIRRGGGHAFALRPRDYSYRLPKKALRLATRMAIAAKVHDDELLVLDELQFDAPKTKDMATILKKLGLEGVTTLIATEAHDVNVYKSSRNMENVSVSPVSDLNAYSVLTPRKMLVTRKGLDLIRAAAGDNGSAEASRVD
jgi:large subunit ribosomal protein L4